MTTSLAKMNCPWDARVCAKNSSTGPPAARVHGTGKFTKLRGTFVTTYTLYGTNSTTHLACSYTNHFLLISLGTNACANRNSDNINCHYHPQFAKTQTRPLQQKRVCVHAKEYCFSKGDVPRATTTTTCSAKNSTSTLQTPRLVTMTSTVHSHRAPDSGALPRCARDMGAQRRAIRGKHIRAAV